MWKKALALVCWLVLPVGGAWADLSTSGALSQEQIFSLKERVLSANSGLSKDMSGASAYPGMGLPKGGTDISATLVFLGNTNDFNTTDIVLEPDAGTDYWFYIIWDVTAPGSVTHRVRILLDGGIQCEGDFTDTTGSWVSLCGASWSATKGNYTLTGIVDALDGIAETDENNNQVDLDFEVTGASGGTDIIAELVFIGDQPDFVETDIITEPIAGEEYYLFFIFTVEGATVGFSSDIRLDGQPMCDFESVFAPETWGFFCTAPWVAVPGAHGLNGRVDIDFEIAESNENNNETNFQFTVPGDDVDAMEYRFQRYWPAIQQPWYFAALGEIAVAPDGHVYVIDTDSTSLNKFTTEGRLVWSRVLFSLDNPSGGNPDIPFGVTVDHDGIVYVGGFLEVQRYDPEGEFLGSWDIPDLVDLGAGEQLDKGFMGPKLFLRGTATDGQRFVYVSDVQNDKVLKYRTNGAFVTEWGGPGSGPGQFDGVGCIAVDDFGDVYVFDVFNLRVQKFSADGAFLNQWGGFTDDPTRVLSCGIDYAPGGPLYVSDVTRILRFNRQGSPQGGPLGVGRVLPDGSEPRIGPIAFGEGSFHYLGTELDTVEKVASDNQTVSFWASSSFDVGKMNDPRGIALLNNQVHVGDGENHRVQSFNLQGAPTGGFGSFGDGNGQFRFVDSLDVDNDGFFYVSDVGSGADVVKQVEPRVQKFNSNGSFVDAWDLPVESECDAPRGLAVDGNTFVYVLRGDVTGTCVAPVRVEKYSTDGTFLDEFGEGLLTLPQGIDVDAAGFVYVSDVLAIHKFSSNGSLVSTFAGVVDPIGIAVDNKGLIYAKDQENGIVVLSPAGLPLGTIGELGNSSGQLARFAMDIVVHDDGRVFVADSGNNRIEVFEPFQVDDNNKAILLAGGGPFPGNDLWDATESNANFAYRTLAYQGFRREEIQYLSADQDLDLDQNGLADDVDADATNANLQAAITTWASDADNLLVYLVDHGGGDAFRMGETEILTANQLGGWIDQVQGQLQANCAARGKGVDCGRITIVYDACRSGSFMDALVGNGRVIMTSAEGEQNAYFTSQGSLSFSNHFWTHVFNGQSTANSFLLAKEQTETALPGLQNPQLDADGNGIPNQASDTAALGNLFIGNGTTVFGDAPTIGSVSDPVTLAQGNLAEVEAFDVTDDDGIARVWAVIRPPNFEPADPENPIAELPSFDLLPSGGGNYAGTYDQFSTVGTYQLAIYARDAIGNASVPRLTSVSVESPLSRRAVIIAGGELSDDLWPGIERSADVSYDALVQQGYSDDDIYYLSAAGTPGVDASATLNNVEFGLTEFGADQVQDLAVYLVGDLEGGELRLNANETLSAEQLDAWLDGVQASKSIPGTMVVIIEGPRSGSFLEALLPPNGQERIVVSSSSATGGAAFLQDGEITFSKYFWGRVLNGASVKAAFDFARDAIQFTNDVSQQQFPQLDDNGNGNGNDLGDGQVARLYAIGAGILLAGDDPVIGAVNPPQTLNGGTSALLVADDVTTTGEIDEVFAIITPPGFQQTGGAVDDLPRVSLSQGGKGNLYQATYNQFTIQGVYEIATYAVDGDGVVSFPKITTVTQNDGVLPPLLPASIAGSWFDQTHAGEGFLIEVVAPGVAVVYWFTFDENGNQRWFFGVGTIVENRVEIAELLVASGGVFGPGFDPDAISFSVAGSATFSFSGCDAGVVDFVVDGTPGQLNLDRITNIEGLSCVNLPDAALKSALHGGKSGSWFDVARNGEGFLVEVIALPNGTLVIVVYFFTFDPDGNLAWMVASGVTDGTDTLTMEVFQPVGGRFGPDFDPDDVMNVEWGTWTIQLGCQKGNLSYSSKQPGYGSAAHALSRITKQLGVSCNGGSEPSGPPPAAGKALRFDALGDFMEVANSPMLSPPEITIEFWMRINSLGDAAGGEQNVLDMRDSGAAGYNVRSAGEAFPLPLFVLVPEGGVNPGVSAGNIVGQGAWNHVAVTHADNALKLYINSDLVAEESQDFPNNTNSPLRIGEHLGFNGTPENYLGLRGDIDELRIWDHARSPAQLQSRMNESLTGNENGLNAYWNFDSQAGSTIMDVTGNGNDGELNGNPTLINEDWPGSR